MVTKECVTCVYAKIGICFYLKEDFEAPLSQEGKCELYRPSLSKEINHAVFRLCNNTD